MDAHLSNWSTHTQHLKVINLEYTSMWFWHDKLVAFEMSGVRYILDRWTTDMTDSIRREITRLTEGGLFTAVRPDVFERQWATLVKPHIRAITTAGSPIPNTNHITAVRAIKVTRIGDGTVVATADIEHSPDGGRTVLVGKSAESFAVQDGGWVDEDLVVASRSATATLCARLRKSGVTVSQSIEDNVNINI